MIDTIAETLHYLYEGFEVAEEGEDHDLSPRSDNAVAIHAQRAQHLAEMNEARRQHDSVTWEGLIDEAVSTVHSLTEPNVKTDALLYLAATALTAAASVQRQTDALNAEGGSKSVLTNVKGDVVREVEDAGEDE